MPADMVKKRKHRHFTLDELKTIWKYAKPWERALILLALNCGFSKAEIASLQPCEVVKGTKHTFIRGSTARPTCTANGCCGPKRWKP